MSGEIPAEGSAPVRRCLVMAPPDPVRVLHHLPVFVSLAAGGRQLVFCGRDEESALLEPTLLDLRLRHTPRHLDAPLFVDRAGLGIRALRRLACDEALLLRTTWSDVRLATAAGIPRRWGYGHGLAGLGLRPRVPRPAFDGRHELDDGRELVEAMDAEWRPSDQLAVTKSWREAGDQRLRDAHLKLDERPLVGVYAGGAGAPARRKPWGAESFEELLRRLRRKRPAWQLVILATDADLWQAVLLYEKTGKIHPVIGPELAPDGVAAVLSRLDLVIAADTWPLHLAAAVGTATVGFFEGNAARRAPPGPRHRRLERRPAALEVDEVVTAAVDEGDAVAG